MGRKRIDTGPGEQAKIGVMMSAGAGPERIAAELGVSLATAKRRMRELKGVVTEAKGKTRQERRAERAPRPAPSAPAPRLPPIDGDVEDIVIPEDSSLEQIDRWLKMAEEEAEIASGDPDPENHIKWVRLATTLLEARRKVAPLPRTDPNDEPDMVEAAARVRRRWHTLAENLARVASSPLAESIGRLLGK